MRTETDQQESKPATRRARGEGRKQPATKKQGQKAPTSRKSSASKNSSTRSSAATGTRAASRSNSASARRAAPEPAGRTHEAEEAVDRIAGQIGRFAQVVGHEILRATARAREEIEDMVAEAQHIRETIQGPPGD